MPTLVSPSGDDKYGDFAWNRILTKSGLKRLFLHAWKLQFAHPTTGQRVLLESPLAADLAGFVERLKDSASDRHAAP